jgi:hypothetical protein
MVANSVKYWLKMAHPDNPTVKRYVTADEKLREHCGDNSDVVKPTYRSKIVGYAESLEWSSSEIFLLTGFLMGIRALSESIDKGKAASRYRLAGRSTRRESPEELKESQLYWALRN